MSGQDEQTLYEVSGAVERMLYRNEQISIPCWSWITGKS